MATDDLTRRGYDAEMRRHRENLNRALGAVVRAADSLSRRLDAGDDRMDGDARRLLTDAGNVAQAAAALEAASLLSFTLDDN